MNSQNSTANALALPDRLVGSLPAGFTEFVGGFLLLTVAPLGQWTLDRKLGA